jgi:adenylate cyclase class IV
MGFKNREIELKYIISSNKKTRINMENISKLISQMNVDISKKISGESSDVYWKSPYNQNAFIRLRISGNNSEITTKIKDKNTNSDRIEIDLPTDNPEQAFNLLNAILIKPCGKITKKFIVFILENSDTTISLYQIKNHKDNSLFVELEAKSIERVKELENSMRFILLDNQLNIDLVDKSLYELFISK